MRNITFQELLKEYPDDAPVFYIDDQGCHRPINIAAKMSLGSTISKIPKSIIVLMF